MATFNSFPVSKDFLSRSLKATIRSHINEPNFEAKLEYIHTFCKANLCSFVKADFFVFQINGSVWGFEGNVCTDFRQEIRALNNIVYYYVNKTWKDSKINMQSQSNRFKYSVFFQ